MNDNDWLFWALLALFDGVVVLWAVREVVVTRRALRARERDAGDPDDRQAGHGEDR